MLLLFAFVVGCSSSMLPSIAISYGIAQFKFVTIVGEENALEAFSFAQGMVMLLLLIGVPVVGRLADQFFSAANKRHYWIVIGNALGLIALYGFSQATARGQILTSWLCVLLSYTFASNSFRALIPQLLPREKLSAYSGLIGSCIPVALTLNLMLILGALADAAINIKLMYLGGLQFLLSAIAITILLQYRRKHVPERTVSRRSEETSYRQYLVVLVAKTCISIAISGTTVLPLYYITRFGMKQSEVFVLNAAMSAGVILILLTGALSTHYAEKFNKQRSFLALGALFIGVGLIGYASADTLVWAIISGICFQLGLGPVNALGMALVNRVLPNERRYGRDLAIVEAATHFGPAMMHFAMPVVVATGISLSGGDGYSLLFYCLVLFAAVFTGTLFFIKKEKSKGPI